MVLSPQIVRRPMTAFGIDIPIRPSNADRTLEHLLSIPELDRARDEWLVAEPIDPLTREDIARVHSPAYVGRLLGGGCDREIEATFELVGADGTYHRYDPAAATLPLSELRDQTLRSAAATRRGAEIALTHPDRFCFCLAGGMHHGKADYGEGFCVVNDLVIAIRALQASRAIRTAWVVDVDAHKGDGTAALTADDPTITTLSIHMADGWPLDQPATRPDGTFNPVHTPSTIDIAIAAGEEDAYLPRLESGLSRLITEHSVPDFILVVAGADPYELDELPSTAALRLTLDQMAERDRMVYRWGRRVGAPMLWVTAGNYGSHAWRVYATFLEWQLRAGE